MSGPWIAQVIEQLLPDGLNVEQGGGSTGFGHVVVDDGRGQSFVAVNVQRWMPHDPQIAQVFNGASIRPDGTRVLVQRGPSSHGGRGAVEWQVDTLREDGLRIAVSTVNARAYFLPASRNKPVLDTHQLERIALDRMWQRLTLDGAQ
ncbi:hypothetical protein ACFVHS_42260 [Streptomyces sp. NPDC057746]|uniref:hypothetical protein n=1 Tax=Streptomyces sp. NPDC057746 TaxID=3346237 RepID=UPI0036B45FA8